jgi:hypothetical protein
MGISIDKDTARRVLLEEAEAERRGETVPAGWEERIEQLSQACEETGVRTHIAFLGTALLAKATDMRVDAFAVKEGAPTRGAYSARSLGHGVLVPNALTLGLHLGVTGREPLNNQPYFRIRRATEKEILPLVHSNARRPVELLTSMLKELDAIQDQAQARLALRAFIRVRRAHHPDYPTAPKVPPLITPERLSHLVERLIAANSEGGRRAQAVTAGVMDAVSEAPRRVRTGRINDPDRHFAGDVGVLASGEGTLWERVFEVRDKPVTPEDVVLFAGKLAQEGITRGAVLAVAANQHRFDVSPAVEWASSIGVYLVVFFGWKPFIEQALFWCADGAAEACNLTYQRIRERLIEAEASPAAIHLWDAL